MKIFLRYSSCVVLISFLLSACAQKQPEQPPAAPQAPAAQQPAQPAPTQEAQPAATTPPASAPAEAKPAPAAAPQSVPAQPDKAPETVKRPPENAVPKDVVILKAALGGVRFEHKLHAETRKIACETCHHADRAEKSNVYVSPQPACSKCHTPTAMPPMKTKLQAAFHNPTATAGTCIDCHKAEVAKGKTAPVKCLDCHKKENK